MIKKEEKKSNERRIFIIMNKKLYIGKTSLVEKACYKYKNDFR